MNSRRIIFLNVVIIVVIIVAGFFGYYFYNQSTLYLSTNNAQVNGQQVIIAAPTAGKLVNWKGATGANFATGSTVGDIDMGGGKVIPIPNPQSGTIVQNEAVNNEYVAPGTPLAYEYNLNQLDVVANIKETDIKKIKVGDTVDVYTAAASGSSITGTVSQIGLATANTFSLLPTQSTTADFTKVTQVIPVTITLQGTEGIGLVPGMSATVRIHK